MVRVGFLEELADDGRLEERFVVVLQRRDQAAGVECQEGLRLVVRVHFDILIGNLLLFQDCPGSLHEGAAGGRRLFVSGDFVGASLRVRLVVWIEAGVLTTSPSRASMALPSDGHLQSLWPSRWPRDGDRRRDGNPCWIDARSSVPV